MIFIADTPVLNNDLGPQTPNFPMDPLLAQMAVAREIILGLLLRSQRHLIIHIT